MKYAYAYEEFDLRTKSFLPIEKFYSKSCYSFGMDISMAIRVNVFILLSLM